MQNVRIINWHNIINISESDIKGFRLCNWFVFDNSLNKLSLIGVKVKIDKETGTFCSHGNSDDLLENVPFEVDKYVIDKERKHTDDFTFSVAHFNFRFVLNKINYFVTQNYE